MLLLPMFLLVLASVWIGVSPLPLLQHVVQESQPNTSRLIFTPSLQPSLEELRNATFAPLRLPQHAGRDSPQHSTQEGEQSVAKKSPRLKTNAFPERWGPYDPSTINSHQPTGHIFMVSMAGWCPCRKANMEILVTNVTGLLGDKVHTLFLHGRPFVARLLQRVQLVLLQGTLQRLLDMEAMDIAQLDRDGRLSTR
jgi:hypothetical protein